MMRGVWLRGTSSITQRSPEQRHRLHHAEGHARRAARRDPRRARSETGGCTPAAATTPSASGMRDSALGLRSHGGQLRRSAKPWADLTDTADLCNYGLPKTRSALAPGPRFCCPPVLDTSPRSGIVKTRSWGPSHQWADTSLRLHTFATVIGLMLVSLGPPDAGQPEIREQHGEDTVGDKSHAGTRAHERAGSACDSDTCPGPDGCPAQGGQGLRSRTLASDTSFI